MSIEKTIEKFLLDEPETPQDIKEIQADEPLIEGGIIDSMTILKLIAFMEEKFDITLSDEDITAENFASIQDIAILIKTCTNE